MTLMDDPSSTWQCTAACGLVCCSIPSDSLQLKPIPTSSAFASAMDAGDPFCNSSMANLDRAQRVSEEWALAASVRRRFSKSSRSLSVFASFLRSCTSSIWSPLSLKLALGWCDMFALQRLKNYSFAHYSTPLELNRPRYLRVCTFELAVVKKKKKTTRTSFPNRLGGGASFAHQPPTCCRE